MKTPVVRTIYLAVTATALVFAACGDSFSDVGADKLASLDEGVTRSAVFEAMGKGPLTGQFADTLQLEKGFRRANYLIGGQQYEVIYYRELPGNVAEPVDQAKETPIVLKDGKVLGWGWRFYVDQAMAELKLPSPLPMKIDPNAPGVNKGALPPSVAPSPNASGDSAG